MQTTYSLAKGGVDTMRMCRAVVDSYIHWLSKEFEVAEGDNDCYIITPFLSPNADHIGIRAVY